MRGSSSIFTGRHMQMQPCERDGASCGRGWATYRPAARWMFSAVHPAGAAAENMAYGRGLRHLRMALRDAGVFRPLRRAGISPVATGDRGRCPLDPCDFLKKIE